MKRLIFIVLTTLLVACGVGANEGQKSPKNEVPKPPYLLPTFDGDDKKSKDPPKGEYKLAPLPNARELFDMVRSCWPEQSWLRAELSADARVTRRISDTTSSASTSFDPISGQYTTNIGNGEKFIGLTFRIPLFSAMELDKERERELTRRSKIAESVGEFVTALAEMQMAERELVLMKSLEKRAQERVSMGVAETKEQVTYLEKVASVDRSLVTQKARLIKSRVQLQGMCDEKKAWVVDEYLKRFKDVQ